MSGIPKGVKRLDHREYEIIGARCMCGGGLIMEGLLKTLWRMRCVRCCRLATYSTLRAGVDDARKSQCTAAAALQNYSIEVGPVKASTRAGYEAALAERKAK